MFSQFTDENSMSSLFPQQIKSEIRGEEAILPTSKYVAVVLQKSFLKI